jgi:hypothetical protein
MNMPGIDGHRGAAGSPANFHPRAGVNGLPGTGQITVRKLDGTTRSYPSKYSIDLVSFQIVDENDDGIIEPGEHIFIHQIIVHNKGRVERSR